MTQTAALPHEVAPTGPAAMLAGQLQALIPALETARLVLRAPTLDDFATYADILMSDRARFIDGPYGREGAWLDFTQYASGWLLRGMGTWTVERKPDATLLGFVNLAMENGDLEPELGYVFTEAAEGHGYATEAASLAKDYAQTNLKLASLVSYIEPGNIASERVAQKLGAWNDKEAAKAFDEPLLVYRHLPEAQV